jgi:hypothetical protein
MFSIISQPLFPHHAVHWSSMCARAPCVGIITTTNNASSATPKSRDNSLFIFIQLYEQHKAFVEDSQ